MTGLGRTRQRARDPRELAGGWSAFQQHGSAEPAPGLRGIVSRYWWARWDLRGQPPYRQLLPPTTSVQLTVPTDGPAMLRGVHRRRFHRVLSGEGGVFGVAFRPGVFRRYLRAPVRDLTDRTVAAAPVFGAEPPAGAAAMDAFLLAGLPPRDPAGDLVAEWAEIAAGSDVRRVDELAARCSTTVRQLQRQFAEHLGVSPKWLLRRLRLQEVTACLAAGTAVDWAGLAADLGYADQGHLSRDFAAMFGEPPTAYAARY